MAGRAETLTLNRRVFGILVLRDLKVRYAGSVLGYLWTILDPLLTAMVYWFIFGVVIKRTGPEPYIVFLLAGMLPWQWANGVITESSRAITSEAKLVRSAGIPREIWVARVVASKFLEYLFALPILIAFMLIFPPPNGVSPEALLDYPLAILIMGTMIFGIGLFLAPLSVLYRDLVRVVRIVLRLLFYFSPIIYSTQTVRTRLHGVLFDVYTLNPFAGVIELFRKPIFPDQFIGWHMVVKASVAAVVFLGIGVWVFRRLEGTVLKEI